MATKIIKVKLTKAALVQRLADALIAPGPVASRTQASAAARLVLEELAQVAAESLRQGGAGMFMMPGLVRFTTKVRPAIKKGTPTYNPFTKETVPHPGRAKSLRVVARPAGALRKAVE